MLFVTVMITTAGDPHIYWKLERAMLGSTIKNTSERNGIQFYVGYDYLSWSIFITLKY